MGITFFRGRKAQVGCVDDRRVDVGYVDGEVFRYVRGTHMNRTGNGGATSCHTEKQRSSELFPFGQVKGNSWNVG